MHTLRPLLLRHWLSPHVVMPQEKKKRYYIIAMTIDNNNHYYTTVGAETERFLSTGAIVLLLYFQIKTITGISGAT